MDKHDRPYRCTHPSCAKLQGFVYSGGPLRHEREVHGKHGGPKGQLMCPHGDCKRHTGKGFTRKENLNEHIRRVHQKVSEHPFLDKDPFTYDSDIDAEGYPPSPKPMPDNGDHCERAGYDSLHETQDLKQEIIRLREENAKKEDRLAELENQQSQLLPGSLQSNTFTGNNTGGTALDAAVNQYENPLTHENSGKMSPDTAYTTGSVGVADTEAPGNIEPTILFTATDEGYQTMDKQRMTDADGEETLSNADSVRTDNQDSGLPSDTKDALSSQFARELLENLRGSNNQLAESVDCIESLLPELLRQYSILLGYHAQPGLQEKSCVFVRHQRKCV